LHLAIARGDQILDVLGGLRGALRQTAHFGGDHCEAASGIAGARRLDGGIKRQQVGLPRDLVSGGIERPIEDARGSRRRRASMQIIVEVARAHGQPARRSRSRGIVRCMR